MRYRSIKFITTVLILALGMVAITIFGYFSYRNTKAALEKRYYNEAEMVLKHTMLSFNDMFEQIEKNIEMLSQNEDIIKEAEVYANGNKLVKFLTLLQKSLTNSRTIHICLNDGTTFSGPEMKYPASYDPRKKEWYVLAQKADGKDIWTEPYLDYMSQRIIITAAKSIRTSSGEIGGVIGVDMEVSRMSEIISNSSIGKRGFVMLLTSNGTVIANQNNSLIGENLFDDSFQTEMTTKKVGEMEYALNKERYILKFDTMEKNGMILVTAISRKELDENLLQALLPVLITGAACLLVFGMTAYFSAIQAIIPLENLVALMKKAENGNYNVFARSSAYKEMMSLSNSFNSMIDSIRKRDERIMRLAYYDSLTGLPNRTNLIEAVNTAVENTKSGAVGGTLLYLDIDNFKEINDTMGHVFGDAVLKEIADRLRRFGKHDIAVARIGGDEFIILAKDLVTQGEAADLLDRVVAVLEEPVTLDSKSFSLTTSIGAAFYPAQGETWEELLKNADMAMYKAKGLGKNRYMFFDESMREEMLEKVAIENGLKEALRNNEFELHYQPQYDAETKRIYCMEALIRWNSPTLGRMAPQSFIKIAEETGLIILIEKWVLKSACKFAKRINKEAGKPIKVSVNISGVHIMHSDFVMNVMGTVAEVGVKPELLELEITETVMMDSFYSNEKKLLSLKSYGINIHLDDFGSGYSSLSYLQKLPIDYLKIDKSFVENIVNSDRNCKIVAAVMELAHKLGLRVVAEGVESKEQLSMLSAHACDIYQGFYFCKPLPETEVEKLILQRE